MQKTRSDGDTEVIKYRAREDGEEAKGMVLKDEVVQAVKDGLFHIYPISKIDEGIELLMGLSAGKKNKTGNFPANSVHGRVMKKLKAFDKRAQGEEE